MIELIEALGNQTVGVLFLVSNILRDEFAPGVVGLVLLLLLILAIGWLWWRTQEHCNALNSLNKLVVSQVNSPEEFNEHLADLRLEFKTEEKKIFARVL